MSIVPGFADVSLLQLFLVAAVPLFAAVVGGLAGAVTAQVLAYALLIGAIALPGAFPARTLVKRMPVHVHTAILDVAVIAGSVVMISASLRQLI